MKKVNLLTMFVTMGFFTLSFGQSCKTSCDSTNLKPTDYKGQICWFLNEVCWGENIPKLKGQKLIIENDSVIKYLNYNYGASSFYLDAKNTAWGGYWFPCKYGGIAVRWRTNSYPTLNSLSWNKVTKMNSNEIINLSPAEKLDIILGNKDFAITKYELQNRGPFRSNLADSGWCGFCNGARSAGALLPEPTKNISVHPTINNVVDNSITVEFSPADLKALATAAFNYNERAVNFGENYCDTCIKQIDPNPATLDFMLRIYLSAYKMPFFIDVKPNREKWNETILGYKRLITNTRNVYVGEFSNTSIKKVIDIDLSLFCQDEVNDYYAIDHKTTDIMANKTLALSKGWVKERKYKYKLLVDENNNLIDGIWVGSLLNGQWTNNPIDYIWIASGGGTDENNSQWFLNPGNKNLRYLKILELVQQAADQ